MAINFGETERRILGLFKVGSQFAFEKITYMVEIAAKPSPSRGECKTDLYLRCRKVGCLNGTVKEFKISVKQDNHDFLENKVSLDRAKNIFGENASEIIFKSLQQFEIKKKFEEIPLISFVKRGRTEAKAIALGWKFELMNKKSGDLSGIVILTDAQKVDIYSGTTMSYDKKNSNVNGDVIQDSGVANYILVVNHLCEINIQEIINQLIPIDSYIKNKNIYFACKALNYRAEKNKWDGDRPLAVYVNWLLDDNSLLHATLVFENPLTTKGNEIGENIRNILLELAINKNNFSKLESKLHASVKFHK